MKKIVGIGMLALLLSGGIFLSNAMSMSDFFRGLIGWNYTQIKRSCIAQAIDLHGNIINVQGVYIVCESGNASCTPTSCEALRP